VNAAGKAADCDFQGFFWLQGGKDMKYDTGKNYLEHLKDLVKGLRKEIGEKRLPFFPGSYRNGGYPDDLSKIKNDLAKIRGRPFAWFVLQGHFLAAKELPPARMVALRDIERHPQNVHFNTKGLLDVGRLFAEAFLEMSKQ